jgi:membrane-bound serine protease (ClpP class)
MEPSSLTLAYVLIAVGFLLLIAELFIPTGGVLFVLSLAGIIIGVTMTFLWSQDPRTGIITLIIVFIALPVVAGLGLYYWPRTPFGRRFLLSGPEEDATVATMPVNVELEQLRGRYGRAVSALRPAGITDFDGRHVDTITEGMMVEPGQWVRCIDVRAGKVIVRAVDKPNLGDLETAEFG